MRYLMRPGNVVMAAVVLLAAGLALHGAGGGVWRGDPGAALNFAGRFAGVLGTVALLLAAAVSIRVPRLDLPFGGITELWMTHHVLGAASFVLLLLHPILLALAKAPASARAPADLLLPGPGATAAWLGWAALISMMVFLAPTFFFLGEPRYQRWKALHGISALAVVLGMAHTLLVARTVPVWFWVVLTFAAVGALAFRLGYRKLRPGRRFEVTEVAHLTDDVVELSLAPVDGGTFTHAPGQFIYLAPMDRALSNGYGQEHPYTISSAPGAPYVRTAIKALGDASTALQGIATGSAVYVDGPYGDFFEPGECKGELWIGGGIGITPFVGRARTLRERDGDCDVHLIYCANDPSRSYYLEELEGIAGEVAGFSVTPHYYYHEGVLASEWIKERAPDLAEREVYVCGPAPLVAVVRAICREAGIPARRIHTEAFAFL